MPDLLADLLPVVLSHIGTHTLNTVNAKDLHEFLGIRTECPLWIRRRIEAYGFLQGIDFAVFTFEDGPSRTIEWHLSLDMAKQVAMVERTDKGKEARQYFLACERAAFTGAPVAPALPSTDAQLETIRKTADLLSYLGGGTERDRLMLMDWTRNTALSAQGLLATSTCGATQGFSVAERVAALGYRLSRQQQAAFYGTLGKRIAQEWRDRTGEEPQKEPRYVDGATRLVSWYPDEASPWVDPMIQSFLAGLVSAHP